MHIELYFTNYHCNKGMFINDLLTTHLFHGLGNSSTRIFLKSALKSRARDLNSLRESMHKRVVQDIRTTEIEDIAHLILKVLRLFLKITTDYVPSLEQLP